MEVEEEGQREQGRKDAAEQPPADPAAGWRPRPDLGTGVCHTGSPKRCFFFTGFRGLSLRRSSSTSDSSISSSAEIRI